MALMYGGTFLQGAGRRVRRGGALGDEDAPKAKKKYVITRKPSKKQNEAISELQRQIDVEDAQAQEAMAPALKPKKPRAKPTPESRQKRADAKARREMLKRRKEAIDNYNNVLTQEDVNNMPDDEYASINKMLYDDRVHKGLNLRNRILGHNAYTDAKGKEHKASKNFYGPDERMSEADKNELSLWLFDKGYGNGGGFLQEGGVNMGGRRRKGGQSLGGQALGGQVLGGQPLGGVFMGGRRRKGGVHMGGQYMGGAWYDTLLKVASTVLPMVL